MAKGAAVEGGGGEGVEVMCDAASRSSVPRLPARAAGAERLTMHAGGERPWAMHGVVMLARTDAKARWSWVRRRHENFASRRLCGAPKRSRNFFCARQVHRTRHVKSSKKGEGTLYGCYTAQTVNRPSSRMSQNLMFDLFLLLLLCMHRPPSRLDARRASKLPPPHPLVHPLPLLPLLLPRPLGRG